MTTTPLLKIIRDEIYDRGPVTFCEFMGLALYHEKWGYYTRHASLGRQGDFYTSPHVTPLFGRMLARQLHEMWRVAGCPDQWVLVEYGPGEGLLCRDILTALRDDFNDFYRLISYRLLEISPLLASRQREQLAVFDPPADIEWIRDLGGLTSIPFTGCVFSNELVDAFPVHLVQQAAGRLKEFYVTTRGEELKLITGQPSSPKLDDYFRRQGITLEEGQMAEVNLEAERWLKAIASHLARGFILTIDYGSQARPMYAPARFDGTLRCFSGHQLKTSPLENIGQQDITASVNFTALELYGEGLNLKSLGLVSQSQFLTNLGIFEELRTEREFIYDPVQVKKTMAVKQLVMPGGMGDVFKVLIQYTGFDQPPRLSGIEPYPV